MDRHQHGLPVVNHLLQHTLRSICTDSQWVYAVFWRILPRNYPPPKWDNETGFLDRSKGNKRNWILTWEDGFCDFAACAKGVNKDSSGDNSDVTEPLQPELFFKMSHEVYSYGEGLMGKVASDSSHKWIFKDPNEQQDSGFVSPWHGSLDPHPRTWESQFKAGIQTIAIVAVQEGLLQLGAVEKVFEDLNLVILLQRKFTYLQSIPGVFAPHPNTLSYHQMRPRVPLSHHNRYGILQDDSFIGLNEQQRVNLLRANSYQFQTKLSSDNQQSQLLIGMKRMCSSDSDEVPTSTYINTGRDIPERPPLSKSLNTGLSPPGVISHLQPSMSSLHALLSKLPSVSTVKDSIQHRQQCMPSLSRSLSLPTSSPFMGDEDVNAIKEPPNNMQNLSCKSSSSGSTSSTKMSIMPDMLPKGNGHGTMTRDKLSMYLEAFENVPEFGIQNELDAYNSFLSEIIN